MREQFNYIEHEEDTAHALTAEEIISKALREQDGLAIKIQCPSCGGVSLRHCEYCNDAGYVDEETEELLQSRIDWEIDRLIEAEERKWKEASERTEHAVLAYI